MFSGYAYFYTAAAGKVKCVWLEAVLLTPFFVSASAFVKVALMGLHDAHIRLGKSYKTSVAEAVIKSFLCFRAAKSAVNIAMERDGNFSANQFI